ncbi:hypothetical protein SAMN05216249_1083 [Acetitomaculum ruminis DSM 5522]|uniref:Membrane transport protein n=1 Tax=Acetitomaculum ruminis DSM 5522 TaxID=1120918 RepID=A0A1I0XWZ0_9FIRM|nr:AEC family transporter [Acetitomaculum ruminis]SFB05521.1 hypothetical protein SAMN05216249_1083 [Acetitomaculum ruminis DSM 5522]
MSFMPIFEKMVELFIVLIIGYIGNKTNVITPQIKQGLTKVVLNITLPCTALSAVMNSTVLPGPAEIIEVCLIAFLTYIPLYILEIIVPKTIGLEGKTKDAGKFALMYKNVGFIGFPVTQAIFGTDALLYTSIFNMPFNLLCYSAGISLIRQEEKTKEEKNLFDMIKPFLTPTMIASFLSVIMALCQYKGPIILAQTCEMVGNVTTPAALLIIGASLGEMPVKEMFNNYKAYIITFFSVVVSPIITWGMLHFFVSNELTLNIAVVLSAMPVATSGTMLCVEYGGDEKFMAQVTFLTTLVTVVTIPAVAMFL